MQECNVIIYEDHTVWRNKDGNLHRLDGPAVEWPNGSKEWWVNGRRHRLDGPAIEWANGEKYWYIEGKELTEAEFLKRTSAIKEA